MRSHSLLLRHAHAVAMETWDSGTLSNVKKIPLLTVRRHDATRWPRMGLQRSPRCGLLQVRAGPRDGEAWNQRLKEEYQALIKYVQARKRRLRGFAASDAHAARRRAKLAASACSVRTAVCFVSLRTALRLANTVCSPAATLRLRFAAVEQSERQRLVHYRL